MRVAIDHGNKQIKTASKIFTSGLLESELKPPFGEDIIEYQGKYYSLSDQRIRYLRDKTVDNRFFILTMFAIAYEIEAAGAYSGDEVIDVQLVVGLPPKHYGSLYKKFESYFVRERDVIEFVFHKRPFSIYITEAVSFPQAYAAAMPLYSQLRETAKALIIDIGGITADYLQIRSGSADLSVCDSLEYGVIRLYSTIQSKVNSEMALLLDESEIDAVLLGKSSEMDDAVKQVIMQAAQSFANEFLGVLSERLIELKTGRTIFVGGGSILLRKQIEASQKVGYPMFVSDISANVKGYELLYKASKLKR